MRCAFLLAPLLLCAVALTGCPDEETTDAGTSTPDAGLRVDSGAAPDAAAADALPGEDAAPLPDAAAPDAEPGMDALPSDTGVTSGEVVVRFTDPNLPVGAARAIFHDPSGAVIEDQQSDANGECRAVVPAGSIITVPSPLLGGKGPPSYFFSSIFGVEPGEVYLVASQEQSVTVLGDVEVSFPGFYRGAQEYYVNLGCGDEFVDPSMAYTTSVYSTCVGTSSTATGVLATARDGNQVLAYAFVELVPIGGGALSQVTLPAWVDVLDDVSASLDQPPPGTLEGSYEHRLLLRGATLFQASVPVDLSAGSVQLMIQDPAAGDEQVVAASVRLPGDTGISGTLIRRPNRGPVRFDLSADLFGPVASTTISATPDVARPELGWSGAPAADAIQVQLNGPSLGWGMLIPGTAGTVRVPELPDDLMDARPTGLEGLAFSLALIDVGAIPDYRALRTALAPVAFGGNSPIFYFAENPPPGTLKIEIYGF